jgi:hypothetical protein
MNQMTKDEALKLRLKGAKRCERHDNNLETRYWCDQYKQIATEALAEHPAPVHRYAHWEGRIKELMKQVGMPDSASIASAMKQLVNETLQPDAHPAPVPLTDEQVDAATKAWFENDIVSGRYPFRKRMRAAFAAAHGITKGQP